jgi:putative hemin transport protein
MGTPQQNPEQLTEEIRTWFRDDPSRMTMMGARKFGVPEETVVRALVNQWPITALRVEAFKEIMEAIRGMGVVRVFVRSRAAVVEVTGKFAEFSEGGGFFNAQGDGIDMHILWRDIGAIYAIEKQSHDVPAQVTYSIQFFCKTGDAAFKVFLWENFPTVPAANVEKFCEAVKKYAS